MSVAAPIDVYKRQVIGLVVVAPAAALAVVEHRDERVIGGAAMRGAERLAALQRVPERGEEEGALRNAAAPVAREGDGAVPEEMRGSRAALCVLIEGRRAAAVRDHERGGEQRRCVPRVGLADLGPHRVRAVHEEIDFAERRALAEGLPARVVPREAEAYVFVEPAFILRPFGRGEAAAPARRLELVAHEAAAGEQRRRRQVLGDEARERRLDEEIRVVLREREIGDEIGVDALAVIDDRHRQRFGPADQAEKLRLARGRAAIARELRAQRGGSRRREPELLAVRLLLRVEIDRARSTRELDLVPRLERPLACAVEAPISVAIELHAQMLPLGFTRSDERDLTTGECQLAAPPTRAARSGSRRRFREHLLRSELALPQHLERQRRDRATARRGEQRGRKG